MTFSHAGTIALHSKKELLRVLLDRVFGHAGTLSLTASNGMGRPSHQSGYIAARARCTRDYVDLNATITHDRSHQQHSFMARHLNPTVCPPLHAAAFDDTGCWSQRKQYIVTLLRTHDINAQDKIGWTPLDYAVLANDLMSAKLLLRHGAAPVPMDWCKSIAMVRLLSCYGAVPSHSSVVSCKDRNHYAVADELSRFVGVPLATIRTTIEHTIIEALTDNEWHEVCVQTGRLFGIRGFVHRRRTEMSLCCFHVPSHPCLNNKSLESAVATWTTSVFLWPPAKHTRIHCLFLCLRRVWPDGPPEMLRAIAAAVCYTD